MGQQDRSQQVLGQRDSGGCQCRNLLQGFLRDRQQQTEINMTFQSLPSAELAILVPAQYFCGFRGTFLTRLNKTGEEIALSRFYGTTLRLVRDLGPISRIELMREMEVSPPSLTKIAGRLIEAGLLCTSDLRDEGGFGRPKQYLEIAPTARRVICASLMPGRLEVGLADQGARVLAARRMDLDSSAAAAMPHLVRLVDDLLAQTATAPDLVAGLCLTLPGHIDPGGRQLLAVSRPGWGMGRLIETLEAAFPWPVTLENKVNAMAFAEWVHTPRADRQTLVHIYLDQGLGAGFMRDGHGVAFSGRDALELGHVRAETPGLPCECGLSGCLETVLTADLIRRADDGLTDPRWPVIAQGFANLVNLMNPEIVVFGGELAGLNGPRLGVFTQLIRDRIMPHQRPRIRFCPSALGPDAVLRGAASVALDRFYYSGRGL